MISQAEFTALPALPAHPSSLIQLICQAAFTALPDLPAPPSSLISTKARRAFSALPDLPAPPSSLIITICQFATNHSISISFCHPNLVRDFHQNRNPSFPETPSLSEKSPRKIRAAASRFSCSGFPIIVQRLPDFRAAASRHPCSGFPMLAQPLPDKNLITSYHSLTNLNTLKRPFFAHSRPFLP